MKTHKANEDELVIVVEKNRRDALYINGRLSAIHEVAPQVTTGQAIAKISKGQNWVRVDWVFVNQVIDKWPQFIDLIQIPPYELLDTDVVTAGDLFTKSEGSAMQRANFTVGMTVKQAKERGMAQRESWTFYRPSLQQGSIHE